MTDDADSGGNEREATEGTGIGDRESPEAELREMFGDRSDRSPATVGKMLTEMMSGGADPTDSRRKDGDEAIREELRRLRDEVHDARRELVRIADGIERIADALEE